jgi:hypothetical protein
MWQVLLKGANKAEMGRIALTGQGPRKKMLD